MTLAKPLSLIARICLIASLTACLAGCGNVRTIVVPVGEPVILREPIDGPIKALARHDGAWVETEVDAIPAGWACWYVDRSDLAPNE